MMCTWSHFRIIGTGLAMAVAITLLPVNDIAKLASGFKIMVFIVINGNGCVIVLRKASTGNDASNMINSKDVSSHAHC